MIFSKLIEFSASKSKSGRSMVSKNTLTINRSTFPDAIVKHISLATNV